MCRRKQSVKEISAKTLFFRMNRHLQLMGVLTSKTLDFGRDKMLISKLQLEVSITKKKLMCGVVLSCYVPQNHRFEFFFKFLLPDAIRDDPNLQSALFNKMGT